MVSTTDNHHTSVEENSFEKALSHTNDHSSLENSEIIEEFQTENARHQLENDNASITTSKYKLEQNEFMDNNELVRPNPDQGFLTKTLSKILTGEDLDES